MDKLEERIKNLEEDNNFGMNIYKKLIREDEKSKDRMFKLLLFAMLLLTIIIGYLIIKDVAMDQYREDSITKKELIETIEKYYSE